MDIDYNNLEGVVRDVEVCLVSVVGDRMFEDVGVPGSDVWFLINFYYLGYGSVHCLTRDGVSFHPFIWTSYIDGFKGFVFVWDSKVGPDGVGGGEVWPIIGDYVRKFVDEGVKHGY